MEIQQNETNKTNKKSKLLKKATKVMTKKAGKFFFVKLYLSLGLVALIALLCIGIIASMQATTSSTTNKTEYEGNGLSISEDVLKWRDTVEKYANEYEVPELIPYILAIMQVESGGELPDLMQSSESLGLPVNTLQEEESIEQGVKYLKSAFQRAELYGLENDYMAIIQSYNFGVAYLSYLGQKELTHSLDVAEQYSRDVVAPSLGNTTGKKRSYVNNVSMESGKTYFYANGGNFHYSFLVNQYIGAARGSSGGGMVDPQNYFDVIMEEALNYNGWSYVWGGTTPVTGFDCSGLVQWVFSKAGITTGRDTKAQWSHSVPIEPTEARSGDLVFFKGTYGTPDNISHVGIYINETTMYDSSSKGIGYKTWNQGYWLSHFAGIRRIIGQ